VSGSAPPALADWKSALDAPFGMLRYYQMTGKVRARERETPDAAG
jgi:hypothetical protein